MLLANLHCKKYKHLKRIFYLSARGKNSHRDLIPPFPPDLSKSQSIRVILSLGAKSSLCSLKFVVEFRYICLIAGGMEKSLTDSFFGMAKVLDLFQMEVVLELL